MESIWITALIVLVGGFLLKNIVDQKPGAWLPFIAALAIGGLVSLLQVTGWLEGAVSFTLGREVYVLFQFAAHPYSRLVAFGIIVSGTVAVLFGSQQARSLDQALSICAIVCAVGVSYAADFITLFFFWEMVTVFTAGMIFCNTKHPDDCPVFPLGLRYLIIHLTGGLFLLFGVMQHFIQTGSFMITRPEAGLIFFFLGIGIKAAFIPFHVWVLWGYPNASLFSSVVLAGLSTKIGVYAAVRILPPMDLIVVMGVGMALVGIFSALGQKNLRKLLSYSLVSQVGFIMTGIGLGSYLSLDGGLFHMINHMFYKSLLFMCAGTVFYCIGTEEMDELADDDSKYEEKPGDPEKKPVWKLVPVAFMGVLVGSLTAAGVPPFGGYVSKYLLKAAFEGVEPVATALTAASVGTIIVLSKLVYYGFIKARGKMVKPPSLSMKTAICIALSFCLVLGIWPEIMSSLLPFGTVLNVYTADGIRNALMMFFVGIIIFVSLTGVLQSPKTVSLFERLSIEQLVFRKAAPFCNRIGNRVWRVLEEKGVPSYKRMAEYLIVTLVLFLVVIVFFYARRVP